VAQVPVNAHVFTLYTVIGDAFGWLTVVGFMVVSVWAVMKGRKAGRTPSVAVEQPLTAYNSKIT
jgi:hypothetical protein